MPTDCEQGDGLSVEVSGPAGDRKHQDVSLLEKEAEVEKDESLQYVYSISVRQLSPAT